MIIIQYTALHIFNMPLQRALESTQPLANFGTPSVPHHICHQPLNQRWTTHGSVLSSLNSQPIKSRDFGAAVRTGDGVWSPQSRPV